MSPRGVAIPDIRQRLFAAAERVLERDGPGGLTSRSITAEAECAKGMLHSHFADLDEFIAELVLDRLAGAADQTSRLPSLAGSRTVAENLTEAAHGLLRSNAPVIAGLAISRSGAATRVRQAMQAGASGFSAIQASLTEYLDAEMRHGRVVAGTDTEAIALAIVGTVHHLIMTGTGTPSAQDGDVRRLVDLLIGNAS